MGEVPMMKEKDLRTGETVSTVTLEEDYTKEIEKAIQTHQNGVNHFSMISQGLAWQIGEWIDLRKKLNVTDANIKQKLRWVCKKKKLNEHDPWMYNPWKKTLELREPPETLSVRPTAVNDLPRGESV